MKKKLFRLTILSLLLSTATALTAQTTKSFATAQDAINWASANSTAATAVTSIEITGNNNDADLLLLKTLRNNYATGYFPALDSLILTGQTSAIPESCFYTIDTDNMWLKYISLPIVASIGYDAFRSCMNLQNISLPVATSIESNAFYKCMSLQSIFLPSATSIGSNAFASCTSLQSISLLIATSIGNFAFRDCTNLQSVNFGSNGSISFGSPVFLGVTTSNVALSLNASGVEYANVSGNNWKGYTWKSIDAFVRLANLSLSTGELSPAFDASIFTYTMEVDNSVTSITITATAAEVGSVVSGDANKELPLEIGINSFTITVTAQDGVTTQDYTVTVTRRDVTTGRQELNSDKSIYFHRISEGIAIENATKGAVVSVYTISGRQIISTTDRLIRLPQAGLYIVKVGSEFVGKVVW